jgi:hypothetical protein
MNQSIHVVREQARELEEDCEKGALRDTLLAARWHSANFWLGISSAIAAALAAFFVGKVHFFDADLQGAFGKALGQFFRDIGPVGAALSALFAAILTSTLTFLAPSEKSGDYHHYSNKLRALRGRVRSFIEIDCALSTEGTNLAETFGRMLHEKSEIESSHPIVPYRIYKRSYKEMKKKLRFKKDLKEARKQYRVDEALSAGVESNDRPRETPPAKDVASIADVRHAASMTRNV